ncbi:MAG: FtsX-like permease family protein [Microscillaceae bacterium]|nr:FtsX-like permease family protein [Microscillaceae bacterium]MDW8460157.1 FtsX-like permease family protein [Cytophagales bacterium]
MSNFYRFVAQRLNQHSLKNTKKFSFSAIAARIAIASIAIGLAIILIAFGVLRGFEQAIQDKLFSFHGHFQVTFFDTNNSYQDAPISTNTYLFQRYREILDIAHLQGYIQKPAIIKAQDEVHGVILKGIGKDFYWQKFKPHFKKGNFIAFSKDSTASVDIIISQKIANRLNLNLHDTILVYFVQNPPRFRKLHVCGIYETGMEDLDEKLALVDIQLVRKLNQWADTLVGGYEIFIKDFDNYAEATKVIYDKMAYDMRLERITDKFVAVFDWLILLKNNVRIFLALILIVACFNMSAILLIMIMERTSMIGILKALGATNAQIRQIFLWQAIYLIFRGLLWGNIVGLGICLVQYYCKLIPLDMENYYMHSVPIAWDWGAIMLVNFLTFGLIFLVTLIPTQIIASIQPIKAIRFD